jgi:hypothetical protein
MGSRIARTTGSKCEGSGMNKEERRLRVGTTRTTAGSGSSVSSETNGDVWIAVGNRTLWWIADASNWGTRLPRRFWTNCASG